MINLFGWQTVFVIMIKLHNIEYQFAESSIAECFCTAKIYPKVTNTGINGNLKSISKW